jgi:hypothetical protein
MTQGQSLGQQAQGSESGVSPFPGWFTGWPNKEAVAVRLRNFEPMVFPGLIQTANYARAVISTRVGIAADEVDREVTARLKRQAILGRGTRPYCGSSSTRPFCVARSARGRSCESSCYTSWNSPSGLISWCR